MRFESMAVEWALLWIHFVWAGAAVVVFSSLSAALMAKLARKIQSKAETGKSDMELKVHDQKMRVLRIAVMTSVCLLVNTVVTIMTSVTLEDWSKASDLDLQCSLFETWDTRDILSYSIEDGEMVCTLEDTTGLAAGDCGREEFDYGGPEVPGNRDCYYRPQYDSGRLKCYGLNHEGGDGGKGGEDIGCDCPCKSFADVDAKRPSLVSRVVSLLAQALVSCIVGLNLGLKKDNIKLWFKCFRLIVSAGTTSRYKAGAGSASSRGSKELAGSAAHSSGIGEVDYG